LFLVFFLLLFCLVAPHTFLTPLADFVPILENSIGGVELFFSHVRTFPRPNIFFPPHHRLFYFPRYPATCLPPRSSYFDGTRSVLPDQKPLFLDHRIGARVRFFPTWSLYSFELPLVYPLPFLFYPHFFVLFRLPPIVFFPNVAFN